MRIDPAQVRGLLNAGMTYQAAATQLGTNRQQIAAVAADLGLPPRRVPPTTEHDGQLRAMQRRVEQAERQLARARQHRLDEIRAAVDAGVSVYRIAQVLDLPRTTVVDILRRGDGRAAR